MPKLYYTTTSCGAGNFLAARLSGVNVETEVADIQKKVTSSGANFLEINPKGNVPALVLDDGTLLNENAATLQWIGDQDPNHTILPEAGTKERYEVINVLSYVSSEYHKAVGPLFNPTLSEEFKAFFLQGVNAKLTFLNDNLLKDKEYLAGGKLSVADIYLYICLSWSGYLNIDLTPFPNVAAFFERVSNLDAIKEGHAAMATNPANSLA